MNAVLDPEQLEEQLRAIGAQHYHDKHPFHRMLHAGELDRGQIQAWALNRYYYQSRIPMKDAALMARADDADLRRHWRQRLVDHDGDDTPGGIDRWLHLTESLGLSRDYVRSGEGVLPATRFAVDAYIRFVQERSLLEAVASSLTELFAPTVISERVAGMLRNYAFIDRDALGYFDKRLTQAPRDSQFALVYVQQNARTAAQQEAVMNALIFKCEVLWAQLDALYHAYVVPANCPMDAFQPQPENAEVANAR